MPNSPRFNTKLTVLLAAMRYERGWHPLPWWAKVTGIAEPSLSAYLRQLRGAGHRIEKRHRPGAGWEYRRAGGAHE